MKYLIVLLALFFCHILNAMEKSIYITDSLYIEQCLNKARIFSGENRDSAIYYLGSVLDYSENIKDPDILYFVYENLGNLFSRLGNYPTALTYYFKAVDLLDRKSLSIRDMERKEKYIRLYGQIAQCFSMSDPQKGISYYRKSLEILEQLCLTDSNYDAGKKTVTINNNIGSLFLECNNLDSAELYFNNSMKLVKNLHDSLYYAILYNNLAIIAFEKGDKVKSLSYFEKSADLDRALGDTAQLANVYLNMGEYYFRNKEWKKALLFCDSALWISRIKNIPIIEYKTLLLKTMVCEGINDFRNAYRYKKMSDEMKDSLNSSKKISEVVSLEMKYYYDKYKKEHELKLQDQKQRSFIYLLITIVVIILLLLLFFIFRSNYIAAQKEIVERDYFKLKNENLELENKELKQELEYKEKEVNLHAQYLLKKKELISETLQQVENSEKEGKMLDEILPEVKRNIETTTWNELEVLLQSIHGSFYENLYKKHPLLTSNEKRLCTLIRLNLSTKDISAITGQQLKTIEIARSRLRAKLELKREDNLTTYLQLF